MFVYHFVDPDLRVETFFEKDEAAENGGVDFEIRDIGLSAHLYLRLKKISCRACLLSYYFFCHKNSKAVADVSKFAGGRVFLFSWERLGGC